jgi:hypothetical protein
MSDKVFASLSERYSRYLKLCVPEGFDPLGFSVQDITFKGRDSERFELIHIGDGVSYDVAYVRLVDGQEVWIKIRDFKVVDGNIRNVPKRGRIHMGKTSLMGIVCHGIKSGRAFRGRA